MTADSRAETNRRNTPPGVGNVHAGSPLATICSLINGRIKRINARFEGKMTKPKFAVWAETAID